MKSETNIQAEQPKTQSDNFYRFEPVVGLPTLTFKHLDLFSGIGGFALAAKSIYKERYENVGFCEIDKFCHKVLRKNFGNDIKIFEDICGLDGKQFGALDILTGGFPCQDISAAGVLNGRKGLDGARSGLFYEMLRIIVEAAPRFIVYENSPLLINWIKIIHNELKNIGYLNYGKTFTAREFGFPHKRERYYGLSITNTINIGLGEIEDEVRKHSEMCKQTIFGGAARNKAELERTFSSALSAPSDSDILRTFDGLPDKLDVNRVHALGNAIVPQIAMVLLAAIKAIDDKPELER